MRAFYVIQEEFMPVPTAKTEAAKPVVDPRLSQQLLAEFRGTQNLMGGAPIDPASLFTSSRAKKAYTQFIAQYTITTANEWIVVPTDQQDPTVRKKIGDLVLYTLNFTVPDTTADRLQFHAKVNTFIRNTGFVPYLLDMAHCWDNPDEGVVVGFHKPIPAYKPDEALRPGTTLGAD
jgi:hypothetical protein